MAGQPAHPQVIVTADVAMPAAYVTRAPGNRLRRLASGLNPRGPTVRAPCVAFSISHPTAGTILVDTGMHPDVSTSLREDFGLPMSVMFRSLRPRGNFDEQLRSLGIESETIERVVMTHLHVDHTSGMRLLPRARFTCSAEELKAARSRTAIADGYVSKHLPPDSRFDAIDFEQDARAHGPFPRAIDLLGDGSVMLLSTPGHTAGHMSVLVRLETGPQVLLVGDAAYTLQNIAEGTLPMLTNDDEASRRSLRQIKAFIEAEPQALIVPTHDPDAWKQLA